MRTIVYVDGYNLYYGVLRKTALKWLDLFGLFQDHVLDSEAELVEVRYCTAPVLGRMCDDIESPQRRRQYLQALRKMYPEKIVIVEGKIIATTPFQRLVEPLEAALATVRRYHPDIRLGLVAPIPGDDHRRISKDLSQHAHWSKPLSAAHLKNAQLPDRIPHSSLKKPGAWCK